MINEQENRQEGIKEAERYLASKKQPTLTERILGTPEQREARNEELSKEVRKVSLPVFGARMFFEPGYAARLAFYESKEKLLYTLGAAISTAIQCRGVYCLAHKLGEYFAQ